jgi:NhaA family Na+:H+ antiporter
MAGGSDGSFEFPKAPIDRVVAPIERFLHVSAASGVVLVSAAVLAMLWANSPWSEAYFALWSTKIDFAWGDFRMSHSLRHWINDGLMVVFFFVIGLEVKRELVLGELREMRKAALPIAAAIGGMLIPAALYLALQSDGPAARGWGIPMATDIAFVVGIMAVLGDRIPHGLRVLLLSLAIADDVGAILVIALGYTESLNMGWLVLGAGALAVTSFAARLGVRSLVFYALIGGVVWLGFHESGVHATIAGVILGLMTPAEAHLSRTRVGHLFSEANAYVHGDGEVVSAAAVREMQRYTREVVSPLAFLENALHPWSSFVIMPIFALANAGVVLSADALSHPIGLSIATALVVGKPLGIVVFAFIAVRMGLADLPRGVSWGAVLGGGFLAGIGFTMSIFIAGLALDAKTLDFAKVGVLEGSIVSALLGVVILLLVLKPLGATGSGAGDPAAQ